MAIFPDNAVDRYSAFKHQFCCNAPCKSPLWSHHRRIWSNSIRQGERSMRDNSTLPNACVERGLGLWNGALVCGTGPWFVEQGLGLWNRALVCGTGPWFMERGLGLWSGAWVYGTGPWFVQRGLGLWNEAWVCATGPWFVERGLGLWNRGIMCVNNSWT